ncbi:MAG: hypothetical protein IPM45_03295 [Acidimicrobiales bacterium]|nr:hypothetical protein [Acidimicrobiales bacterium]
MTGIVDTRLQHHRPARAPRDRRAAATATAAGALGSDLHLRAAARALGPLDALGLDDEAPAVPLSADACRVPGP